MHKLGIAGIVLAGDRSVSIMSQSGVNSMGLSGRMTSGKMDFQKLQQGPGSLGMFDNSNVL